MAKITSILTELVKANLDEQVQHLLKMSKDKDMQQFRSSKEWKMMYDGAETVINLLSQELGRKDSLHFFAKGMTLDDLTRFRKHFDSLITEIEQEPKVTLWGVYQDRVYSKWFTDYAEAKQHLLTSITEDLEDDDNYQCKFGIDKKQVFESEVSEYLD